MHNEMGHPPGRRVGAHKFWRAGAWAQHEFVCKTVFLEQENSTAPAAFESVAGASGEAAAGTSG